MSLAITLNLHGIKKIEARTFVRRNGSSWLTLRVTDDRDTSSDITFFSHDYATRLEIERLPDSIEEPPTQILEVEAAEAELRG